MSTEHENGGDDFDRDLVHRYREASAGLDERPSASTRAAILAAAARQVHAKPAVAGAAYRRPSWPLAAAAVVMLSTLAVMLAIRTQDEMPQFNAPEQSSTVAEKVAPAPAAMPSAEPPSGRAEVAGAKPSAPARELARSAENRQAPAHEAALNSAKRRESDQAAATAPSERRQAATSPAPVNVPQSVPAPSAPAPAAPALPKAFSDTPPASETAAGVSTLKKTQRDAGAGLQARPQDQAAAPASTPDARTDAVGRVAPAPSVAQERQRAESAEIEPAAAWLERIIRLRREGRHSEADAELKRFRERYPQVQPPVDALPAIPAQ